MIYLYIMTGGDFFKMLVSNFEWNVDIEMQFHVKWKWML